MIKPALRGRTGLVSLARMQAHRTLFNPLLRLGLVVLLVVAVPAAAWGWVIVAQEDYETGTASGWNNNTVTDSGHADYTKFLGRFSRKSGQGVYKTFALPGTQALVRAQFDFYRLDSWDNEYFRVYIDDVQVANHRYGTAAPPGVTFLGGGTNQVFSHWADYRFRYTFTVPVTDTDIKLGFGDSLNSGISDESWGIDNLVISYLAATGERTWDGAAPGNWNQGGAGGHWDDGPPPPSGSEAAVPTGTEMAYVPSGTVNVTGAESAFGLDIGLTSPTGNPVVDVNSGGTLTIGANTDIGAAGTLNINGTLDTFAITSAAGSQVNLNNGGTLTASSGTIDTLNVSGTAALNSGGLVITNLNMNSQLDGAGDYSATNTSITGGATFNQASGTATLGNVGGAGGLTKGGGGTVLLNTNNSYAGVTTVNAGILQITNGGALGDTTSGTVVNNGGQLRLSGGITTPIGEPISINGGGSGGAIYNLSGTNNIDGAVTLAGGATIRVDNNRLRLRGGLDLVNNALQINTDGGTAAEINSNPITGTGTLTKEGDGTLEIRVNSPAYTGQINVNNGVLDTNSGLGTGSMNIDGDATLRLRGNVDVGKNITLNGSANSGRGEGNQGRIRNDDGSNTLSGTIAVNSNSRIDVDGGTTLTLSGAVSGSGNIEKTDSGTLVLSGNNTFSGNLSFPAGTLRLESDNALGAAAGAVNLSGGATMEVQGGVNVGAKPINLAGSQTIVNLGGDNTIGGSLTLGPAGSTAPAATINTQAGSLTIGGDIDMNKSNLTVTGAGDTTIDGVISGTNLGTIIATPGLLAGSHSGNVWMGSPNPGNLGIVLGPQGMFRNGGPHDALREAHWRAPRADGGNGPNNTTLIYTGQVNLDPATGGLGDANGVVTFIEQNDDKTRLYVNGVQVISDNNWNNAVRGTYTPPSPGWYDFEVRFSNGGGGYGFFGQTGGGSNWNLVDWGFGYAPGVVGNDDALNYSYPQDPGDASIFRVVEYANPNNLIKDGAGTLMLNGNNTYVGTTDVLAGTLLVNGTTSGQGTYTVHPGATLGGNGYIDAMVDVINGLLSPGMSIGTLTVHGDLTLDGGEFYVEVADTRPGSESFDQLVFEGGTLSLINGASLAVVTPLEALKMQVGSEIEIIDVASGDVSGNFDGLPDGTEFTDQNGVYRWEISYGSGPDYDVTLKLTYIPEPATLALLGLGALALARRRKRR